MLASFPSRRSGDKWRHPLCGRKNLGNTCANVCVRLPSICFYVFIMLNLIEVKVRWRAHNSLNNGNDGSASYLKHYSDVKLHYSCLCAHILIALQHMAFTLTWLLLALVKRTSIQLQGSENIPPKQAPIYLSASVTSAGWPQSLFGELWIPLDLTGERITQEKGVDCTAGFS